MSLRSCSFLIVFGLLPSLAPAAESPGSPTSTPSVSDLRSMLEQAEKSVNTYYMPASKVDKAFALRCKETERLLGGVQSMAEGYALISDALGSLDPRIRFYPPMRAAIIDYSWDWGLIGNEAYVNQVDQVGAARQKGLQLGDRILAIEGIPVSRESYQQVYHLLNVLTALPGLRVLAQSPGGEPRLLAIEATIRERRRVRQMEYSNSVFLERVRSANEEKRREEFLNVKEHVRHAGKTAIWNATELHRDAGAVNDAWRELKDSENLVVDLRGRHVVDHETVLRLAGFLFSRDVEIGRIQKDALDTKLRLSDRQDAYAGHVLVLVDAETAGYAELLAYVIQREQRGVIVGDRTMGRVFERRVVGRSIGHANSFNTNVIVLPAGDVVLSDGGQLDGRGVIPDFQVLPKPADLAGHRDVVLSKALGLLKQKITPEDAYKLFPHYGDEDDEY